MVLFLCMPTVLTASTYLIYTRVHGDDPDNQLTPVRIFMVLALYNLLQIPLGFLPIVITFIAAVSLNKLSILLSSLLRRTRIRKRTVHLRIQQ